MFSGRIIGISSFIKWFDFEYLTGSGKSKSIGWLLLDETHEILCMGFNIFLNVAQNYESKLACLFTGHSYRYRTTVE